jgi:NADPH:quinone reductase-like Zn-dependent oxidoreductase
VLKLQQVAPPTVGDDGVLVRVRATSVNTPDWLVVTGVPYVLRLRSGLRHPKTLLEGFRR